MGGVTPRLRIGIFGGTFDPPHQGHLILAEEAEFQLGLDRLLWVLTADPPHKQGQPITPLEVRLDLLRAAIGENPRFELSRVDIDRPGPHFALDTVRLLREANPNAELAYLIGGDSLRDLPTWHSPADFVRSVDVLGVMRRPGDRVDLTALEAELPGLQKTVRYIDAPLLEISSSQIRQRVSEGRPYRYYVPREVYHLIQARHLYR